MGGIAGVIAVFMCGVGAAAPATTTWTLSEQGWQVAPTPTAGSALPSEMGIEAIAVPRGGGLVVATRAKDPGSPARIWALGSPEEPWRMVGPPVPASSPLTAVTTEGDQAFAVSTEGLWVMEEGQWTLVDRVTMHLTFSYVIEKPDSALTGLPSTTLACSPYGSRKTLLAFGGRFRGSGPTVSAKLWRENGTWQASIGSSTYPPGGTPRDLLDWRSAWYFLNNPPLVDFPLWARQLHGAWRQMVVASLGRDPWPARHPLDPPSGPVLAAFATDPETGFIVVGDASGARLYEDDGASAAPLGGHLPLAVGEKWSPTGATLMVSPAGTPRLLAADGTLLSLADAQAWGELAESAVLRQLAATSTLDESIAARLGTTLLRAYHRDSDRLWVATGTQVLCHDFGT